MKEVIVIYDIGKTNKKIVLFDKELRIVYQHESKFETITDEDGFECDDLDAIEKWVFSSLKKITNEGIFRPVAVNFSTYGASLVYIDKNGKRLTPLYNYLKEIPLAVQNDLFARYGGETEFCRNTASPALGLLLNSGIQLLWVKNNYPDIFKQVNAILHLPQYFSYLFTNTVYSEITSIGCHTFMWDFDKNCYHRWISDNNIPLPGPVDISTTKRTVFNNTDLNTGIGIHDSSASMVPYLKGSNDTFILMSTGTWCINMNPFNNTPLTKEELQNDCLNYMSIEQKPVKSSRFFLGHIHDINVEYLEKWFGEEKNSYRSVQTDQKTLMRFFSGQYSGPVFFKNGMPSDYRDTQTELSAFTGFSEAYHRLIFDLCRLNKRSAALITDPVRPVKSIYISGGFARNNIFNTVNSLLFPEQDVYTSEIDSSSALGAALVVYNSFGKNAQVDINLNLKKYKSIL